MPIKKAKRRQKKKASTKSPFNVETINNVAVYNKEKARDYAVRDFGRNSFSILKAKV